MGERVVSITLSEKTERIAQELAAREGLSVETFLQSVLDQCLAHMDASARFEERVRHADPNRALEILRKAGADEVIPGDELPPGWHDKR
ncbi:hypothetical protein HHL28_14185 [Aerophototrophica crusticola]|uniref:CopG family transcriptional regulator n=1 Tax=Aerophototrophica crusticola TaxID=1709002 RepID=A0A858R9E4_9PROT|nr:hypothetical protein HHL28_14185 [Rhodospirillaceae bacterium B3]